MGATLKVRHEAIGVEVRRGTYDVVVDGDRAGSVELHGTLETPVEPGRHTLQIRNGRNSSRIATFDADEGQVIAFRCSERTSCRSFSCRSPCHPWRSPSGTSNTPCEPGRPGQSQLKPALAPTPLAVRRLPIRWRNRRRRRPRWPSPPGC
jgi:hypothetical protein